MASLFVIWSADKNTAMARYEQLKAANPGAKVIRRDDFALAQAEDLDAGTDIANAGASAYAIVIQMP